MDQRSSANAAASGLNGPRRQRTGKRRHRQRRDQECRRHGELGRSYKLVHRTRRTPTEVVQYGALNVKVKVTNSGTRRTTSRSSSAEISSIIEILTANLDGK